MFRHLLVASIALMSSGCVAVWGQSYNVDIQTPDYIQVNYDDSVINYRLMLADIRSHCARYDKVPKNDSTFRNYWGITMAVYNCVEPH